MKKYTRKEMREIMEIRGFSPNTVEIYINQIRYLTKYTGKSPHALEPEDIHRYQVYLVHEKQVSWSTFNQSVCAMRFFLIMSLAMTGLLNTYPFRRNTQHYLSF